MHLHILGICGTFMGGLALLAREMGYQVTGSDAQVYPPMSTQLQEQGIGLIEGYDPAQLQPNPDIVVIGNAMSRGNPCVEYVLNSGIKYTSGPQFLAEYILPKKHVLAVSGTHGKTSTASMLAWILASCGKEPGFLIGGVPSNFGISAKMGESKYFVVEADEYDSAFFDKRAKFVHYHPKTLVINNLEFDHADIYQNLSDIQRQFHHVIRTVPSEGKIIYPADILAIDEVINMGCWSKQETLNTDKNQTGWYAKALTPDAHHFQIFYNAELQGELNWTLIGEHNLQNAMMAIAASYDVGVNAGDAIDALESFISPKRRLELLGTIAGIAVYDDFAHHPTAIATTLAALRAKVGSDKITLVLEPRSNTMKQGIHQQTLAASFTPADRAFVFQPDGLSWDLSSAMSQSKIPVNILSNIDEIVDNLVNSAKTGEHIVIMSNGGFGGIHQKIMDSLKLRDGNTNEQK